MATKLLILFICFLMTLACGKPELAPQRIEDLNICHTPNGDNVCESHHDLFLESTQVILGSARLFGFKKGQEVVVTFVSLQDSKEVELIKPVRIRLEQSDETTIRFGFEKVEGKVPPGNYQIKVTAPVSQTKVEAIRTFLVQ